MNHDAEKAVHDGSLPVYFDDAETNANSLDPASEGAAQILLACLSKNTLKPRIDEVVTLTREIRAALLPPNTQSSAGMLICLDCRKPFAKLTRHIQRQHGMTKDQYRQKWNLAMNHPMELPSIVEQRKAESRRRKMWQAKKGPG
jgi:hypothetical protein